MVHLKKLMESVGFEKGRPAQEFLSGEQGEKYDYISIFAGEDFLLAHTYTGREISLSLEAYRGKRLAAYWMDPVTGLQTYIRTAEDEEKVSFLPPEREDGTDIVLVLKAE